MPDTTTEIGKNWVDCHLFTLRSQGSMYTMSILRAGDDDRNDLPTSIIAAPLSKPIFSLGFSQTSEDNLLPSMKELQAICLPGNVDIVSIDAFYKPNQDNVFVVGVAACKLAENTHALSVHILKEELLHSYVIDIKFVPYQLYHFFLSDRSHRKEVAWLLSGSDRRIHLFRESSSIPDVYAEVPVIELFPEFDSETPSVVLWMDGVQVENTRLFALGCECGALRLTLTDASSLQVLKRWNMELANPISSVRFFTRQNLGTSPSFLREAGFDTADKSSCSLQDFHLLVTNTLLPSRVYDSVSEWGLARCSVLPGSDNFDAVICSTVADINMDGTNEIILGTYGQELLIYHQNSDTLEKATWSVLYQKSFSHPLLSVYYEDVTMDGIRELIVMTTRGVQVLQHELSEVAELCVRRLNKLLHLIANSDSFRALEDTSKKEGIVEVTSLNGSGKCFPLDPSLILTEEQIACRSGEVVLCPPLNVEPV